MESAIKQLNYERAVRAYHYLPVVTAIVSVTTFIGAFLLTGSYLLSGIAAAIPSSLLLWKWTVSAMHVDEWLKSWACPKCATSLPKKMYWSYPPRGCPHCGEQVR
jgi:hypothetical protein